MAKSNRLASVIVPLREVARVFATHESAINTKAEAGAEDDKFALSGIGLTLRKINEAPSDEDLAGVMATKQHGPVSRLQSLIASGEGGNLELVAAPAGGLEAKFDTHDVLGWASVAWQRIKNPVNHPLLKAPPTAEAFPNKGRVAVLGDWGTGLYGAPVMAETITKDPDPYAMLLHLGDVYYSGSPTETQERFLALWPKRAEAIQRYTNGNHEMYSGGYGYFDETLPKFKQQASYFAHQNDHWTLVGLDLAYQDHAIDQEQVNWLAGILKNAGNRKVVLFSHHQLFSQYETQGTKLWANAQFQNILKGGQIFAWYWGHEHRCCIYQPHQPTGILARCIGHGGMPQGRKPTWNLAAAANVGPNWADWRQAPSMTKDGLVVPQTLLLEGPNPYIEDEADKFLPNGYAILNFDGPQLTEQVLQPDGTVIYEKALS